MSNPPSDKNIPLSTAPVEEAIEWVSIAVATPLPLKQEVRATAQRAGLTLSEWGRKVFEAALANDRRSGEDRRKTA